MFILSDHNGSYRFYSLNMKGKHKGAGSKNVAVFKEIAAQGYILQVKVYFILYYIFYQYSIENIRLYQLIICV